MNRLELKLLAEKARTGELLVAQIDQVNKALEQLERFHSILVTQHQIEIESAVESDPHSARQRVVLRLTTKGISLLNDAVRDILIKELSIFSQAWEEL